MWRFLVIVLALAVPASLHAQWLVAPQAGAILYDEASTLETMPVGSIEFTRPLTDMFALSLGMDYARGQIDGERFPTAQLDFGQDSTINVVVNQPVSAVHYGGRLEVGRFAGRLQPYAAAGAGGYTLFLNSQQHDQQETVSGISLQAGAGIRFGLTESSSLVLDARDVVYLSFDPNELSVVEERFENDRFPELNPEPLEEGTMHNIRLTLGFTFLPGEGR